MQLLSLHDDVKIPQLGLGTAGIGNFEKTKQTIKIGLEIGYRRFDTASMYGNEEAIGTALKESTISREEIIIVTKLWDGGNFSYENTIKECKRSLERLKLEYVDIYLHHWPVKNQRLESWKAMEKLVEEGYCHHIGVSNYTTTHLEELKEFATIQPVLNQVEFNPFLFQQELLKYCNQNSVLLEAYSPLVQGRKLRDPTLMSIAKTYGKSTTQLLIRWAIQHKLSVIPKASSYEHLRDNFEVFDFSISDDHMSDLNRLDEGLRLEWDPTEVP